MSCISSNFSSFFLNSLNDPSEFSKYLSNGELRFSSSFEDFQVYGQTQQQQQQQYQQHHINNGELINGNGDESNSNIENTQPIVTSVQHYGNYQPPPQHQLHPNQVSQLQQQQARWVSAQHQQQPNSMSVSNPSSSSSPVVSVSGGQHFDGSFEFMKYLRHSNDYNDTHSHEGSQNQIQSSHTTIAVGTKPEASLNNSFMDLDNAHKRAAARKTPVLSSVNGNNNVNNCNSHHPTPMAIDIYDHDSKHNIYDLHHMSSVHSSNSNESSMELSSMTYPNSHLNASNSNTSSEGGGNNPNHSDFSMLSGVANSQQNSTSTNAAAAAPASPVPPKPLASFTIMENFEAHPSHKVEEGIFQHMNKLPSKKKENLKQLGVRFTGQMTLNDKSIIVENFIKFCQEYDIKDHRPFLTLNQSGLNKPDQIKFARYLGQGLPTFTLFCIYSNFKNLFCTKRTEIYTKDGYNLPYILDKVKRFLANTTAGNNNNNASNSSSTSITTTTSTTIAASSSNTIFTNSNTTPNNTTNITTTTTTTSTAATTTTIMNTNNCNNNATNVPVALQNGNSVGNGDGTNSSVSNSNNSSSSVNAGNDNDKGIGNSNSSIINNNNNDIINTPTKQIYNVPSPVTPQMQPIHQPMQIQQTPTQNTPLPAHPPPTTHTIISTHHATTPQNHLQQHHNNNHHQQQQQQQQQQIHHHHLPHMQIPISPMVVVSTAAPSALLVSPMIVPTVATTVATITQTTTNQHQLQHPHPHQHQHHMQPNNHHLAIQHHPHHVHQPPMLQHPHHTSAANNTSVAITTAPTTFVYQQPQQHQHQHQLQQTHHPLHNLAAQNPPL